MRRLSLKNHNAVILILIQTVTKFKPEDRKITHSRAI